MKKNLLLALLFILASCAILNAKNDGPKIQGWTEKGEYKESAFKDDSIIFMKYSADGKKLFVVSMGGAFRELDIKTGEISREFKTGVYGAVDYDEDGDNLVFLTFTYSPQYKYNLICYNQGLLKYQVVFDLDQNPTGYLIGLTYDIKVNSRTNSIFCSFRLYNDQNIGKGGIIKNTFGFFVSHELKNGSKIKRISSGSYDKMEKSQDDKFLVLNNHYKYFYYDGFQKWENTESIVQNIYDIDIDAIYTKSINKSSMDDLCAISRDSKYFVTKTLTDSIYLRNMTDLNIANKFPASDVSQLSQTVNKQMLVALHDSSSQNLISLYDFYTGNLVKFIKRDSLSHTGKKMDLSPDSVSLAILGYDGRIRIYNPGWPNIAGKSMFLSEVKLFHAGEVCKFLDKSTDNPKSWLWNFGDGTTSIEQNPEHIFQKSGNYSIKLISDYGNKKDTCFIMDYIKVLPAVNPKFEATSTGGLIPLEVTFSLSTDCYMENIEWIFGDSTIEKYDLYSKLAYSTKIYDKLGKFVPRVRIYDGYHYHEYTLSDTIITSYSKPEAFDVLFEKEFYGDKIVNYIPCGFVAPNGDLVFGRNTTINKKLENADDGGYGYGMKSYYPSELYRYNSKGDLIKVIQFNNEISNFIELSNGNYFLIGSYDYGIKRTSYPFDFILTDHRCLSYICDPFTKYFKVLRDASRYTSWPVTGNKSNVLYDGKNNVYYYVLNSQQIGFYQIGLEMDGYKPYIPQLCAITLDENQKLLSCYRSSKDVIKFMKYSGDSIFEKIDTGAHINKMLYSDKYGYFLVGSLNTGTKTNGVVYLYDKLGNQKMRYVKNDTVNTEFNSILHMGGANFAVAGNSGRTMGIDFVNADSLTVKFVELTGRTGVINAIDKTADGNLFIVGNSIIYGKPKGIVQPGNSGAKNPSEKILMLENTPDEYKGYAALLGVSKILGVSEETPRQSGAQPNLSINQSADIASISYSLSRSSRVSLKLYDILGRPMATIFEGEEAEGMCRHEFQTSAILPGIYLIRLESADGQMVAKIAVGR